MLSTGPWGSVHFFPLCCLYWIIFINLSLSSPTLLCHCCWAHNDVPTNALPSLPHEGQRVEQWTWISIVTWKAIYRYFGTWLLLLFANKKHPCQNDCGEEWKLNILQVIKRARTHTHTHTHPHRADGLPHLWAHALSWLFAPGGCMGWHQTQIAPVPAFIFLSVHPGSCHYSCEKDGQVGLP